MTLLKCDICGGALFSDANGENFSCEYCGTKYLKERVKKMLAEITGTVKVEGVVQVNNDFDIRAGVLIQYNGSSTEVVVPDSVKAIGVKAFAGQGYLEKVTLPEGLKVIGSSAFDLCTSLAGIVIPNSVEVIESGAFSNSGLRRFVMPDTVKDWGGQYGCMFSGCYNLKEIILPVVRSLPTNLFSGCTGLESYTVPNGVEEIGYQCFYECSSLKEIILPQSLKTIDRSAFYRCSKLKKINFPNSLKMIGNRAFRDCSSLRSVELPDSGIFIGNCCWDSCDSLESVTLPDSVQFEAGEKGERYYSPFAYCKRITTIVISDRMWSAYGRYLWETPYGEKRLAKDVMAEHRAAGLCQHCGNTFKGLFMQKCAICGKEKDY